MRGRNWALALAGATLSFLVSPIAAAQVTTYIFTTFDIPGATSTYASAINNAGQIVGLFWDNAGSHGFLYSDGSLTAIDAPGSRGTHPWSINDAGQVVGDFDDGSLVSHGFVYSDGSLTPIDVPGATGTYASGINNTGQVVGNFYDSAGSHGFLYSGESFSTIDLPLPGGWLWGINAIGQTVGFSFGDSIYVDRGFFRDVDGSITTIDVPGGISTDAYGINDLGQIVGVVGDDSDFHYGFFRDADGSFTAISVPNAFQTFTYGVNDAGQIVGGYVDRMGGVHGLLATPAQSSDLARLRGQRSSNKLSTLRRGP